MNDNKIEYMKRILNSHGYNLTEQRKLILRMFLKNPSRHFTPEEIFEHLKEKGDFVGLATVKEMLNY